MELTTVWFTLIAVLWIGYFVLEGFDFGVGMLLPVLANDDTERRVMINTIGPVWDGNEVWVLVAGGATFAAFPEWYATLFSGFYLPLLLILVALIVRGLAFEYRAKRNDDRWRGRWDLAIIVGSFVPALLWGVAFANIVRGVPIDADLEYVGGFFNLLNPYALLGGLMTLLLFLTHGALFIALKTDGPIRHRARALGIRLGLGAAVVAVAFLGWTQVLRGSPASAVAFVLAAAALLAGLAMAARGREGWAFVGTFLTIGLGVAGLFLALFPDVMPTTLAGGVGLTTTNAAATAYTLKIMTVVAVVFTPVVLLYQSWTYWVFRKRIAVHHIPTIPAAPAGRSVRPSDPRLRQRLAPARRPLLGVVGAGVVGSLLVLAQAWVVTGVVVAALAWPDGDHRPLLAWSAAAVVVLALRGLVGWGGDVLAARAAAAVATSLRRLLLVAACRDRTAATGETAVLVTRGVAAVEPYLTRYVPALVLAAVLPPLTVVAIATQDLLSAVIVLLTLPLVPVFGALVGLATRDRARRQWRVMASLSGHFLDVVRGLPTLVAHRRARAQSERIAEITDRYRRSTLDTLRIAFASSAVLELVATLSVALVAVTVGVRLAGGSLDLRTALVVLLLAPEAYWPLRKVGAEFHAAAEGVATFEAAHDLLERVGEEDAGTAAPSGADLELTGLGITHPGRRQPAVHDLTAVVPARGVTVVTGPSGCGKSTLLSALAGLVEPSSGSLRAGGRAIGGRAWQEQVAWLPQQPVFVAGSIADNLRLAAPGADDDALWAALRQVALEVRVRALPGGLAGAAR